MRSTHAPPTVPHPLTGTAVVACGTKVVGYSSRTGDKRWTFDLKASGVASSLSSVGQLVYVVSTVDQSKLVVTSLNSTTGEVVHTQLLPAPWLNSESTR